MCFRFTLHANKCVSVTPYVQINVFQIHFTCKYICFRYTLHAITCVSGTPYMQINVFQISIHYHKFFFVFISFADHSFVSLICHLIISRLAHIQIFMIKIGHKGGLLFLDCAEFSMKLQMI